jgi:glutathione synthase/RimK-type ligase-like ATP-grasp enzyme
MIYIDADKNLRTWKHIADAGNFTLYKGQANRGDAVIRWGANHGTYDYPAGVRVLNPKLCMSKALQGRALENAGVSIPKIYRSTREWRADGTPELIFKPNFGQMGTGIKRVNAPTWDVDGICQLYIDKDREFRAMMVGDIMAFFMEKHPPANGDFRWNEHRGARWSGVPNDDVLRRKARELAYDALKAIKYDFGAVDIILKTRRGGYDLYILEVNSRPEFGPVNAERFARSIIEYLRR